MGTKVAVIYYSSTGTNEAMANAVAEGAKAAGAEVRVRLVAENAPPQAIASNPAWQKFYDRTKDQPQASLEDLDWADAVVFGTPTRFGNVAAQLKGFLDTTGGLWFHGKLANKVYAGFRSAMNANGGQESTLLALYNTLYHWGGVIVTPGYTDQSVFAAGGNPYGPSVTTGPKGDGPTENDLAHARYLGKRVSEVAAKVRA
ncbi:NAD(P)H:quinone oxidoreductase [Sandaracinus amylolyticus]|uniref:NAD(P)H:quinone oxidoreductase n=1 Tax=Sandaracinus amylolyticus TaxID=927083 RepID=UPI001EFFBF08|nr:NAD(P)H:quinone oxidoreductase [Sandaracinus amylolyticus]UJR81876.1 TrpR binding protein WrbA [Sandaracinus amylolyticus]